MYSTNWRSSVNAIIIIIIIIAVTVTKPVAWVLFPEGVFINVATRWQLPPRCVFTCPCWYKIGLYAVLSKGYFGKEEHVKN